MLRAETGEVQGIVAAAAVDVASETAARLEDERIVAPKPPVRFREVDKRRTANQVSVVLPRDVPRPVRVRTTSTSLVLLPRNARCSQSRRRAAVERRRRTIGQVHRGRSDQRRKIQPVLRWLRWYPVHHSRQARPRRKQKSSSPEPPLRFGKSTNDGPPTRFPSFCPVMFHVVSAFGPTSTSLVLLPTKRSMLAKRPPHRR